MDDGFSVFPHTPYDTGVTACLVLSALFAFQFVRQLVRLLPVPFSVCILGDCYVFRWQNLIVSWFHALITGISASSCLWFYWESMFEDMMHFVNWHSFCVCCFATGYFLYDTLDIVYGGRLKQKWDILLHHLAIVLAATYIMLNVRAVGYFVFALIVEMNTAFLHARKLFQMAAYSREHLVVRANLILNLLTFVPFRFMPMIYLSYAFRFERHQMSWIYQIYLLLSISILNVINLVLLYRLLNADVLPVLHKNNSFLRLVPIRSKPNET
ncbi:unnamed protein product [Soboliphyme baturini]|uniref:TLC domain-containing protein n=1 Tax=Soboliphyme baturini TaxID=241478 RepID=A0A183IXG7_9BILA|nr:unnamed protein product [Soboliphyme baturini]